MKFTKKKLTLWEYLLFGVGAIFTVGQWFHAQSAGGESAFNIFSALWFPAAITFVILGGKHRETAFFVLILLVLPHLVFSYMANVWIDTVVGPDRLDFPSEAERNTVGSIRWFAFDATANILAVLIAAKLTFTRETVEFPTRHKAHDAQANVR